MISASYGIDPNEVIKLAKLHPRVNILSPGPGVGGHCIPVDPWFLISDPNINSDLIATARNVNEAKEKWVMNVIKSFSIDFDCVVFLGLTYKPNVDDFRESPALRIFTSLSHDIPNCLAIDPYADKIASHSLSPTIHDTFSLSSNTLYVVLMPQLLYTAPSSNYPDSSSHLLDFTNTIS